MRKEQKEILQRAIDTNGKVYQSTVSMEECSELAQAISKCIRSQLRMEEIPKDYLNHLVEEMADVSICIEMLKQMYNIDETLLEDMIDFKVKRIERRLEARNIKIETK